MKRAGLAPLSPAELGIIASWEEQQRDEDLARLLASEWGRRIACWVVLDLGKLQHVGAPGESLEELNGTRIVGSSFLRRIVPVAPYTFADMVRDRETESRDAIARVRGEQKKPDEETSA